MDITKIRSDKATEAQAGAASASQKSKASQTIVSRDGAASALRPGGASSSEKVNLSPESMLLQEGVATAKASPDVRTDKVASLKAAIKNGTYKVDPQAVADKMLESHLEESLLARKA